MAWKDRITGRTGQQVLTGANFALYTLIVMALIVLVNWFVNNHDQRWDMTPNKKYSLSDQTRKILRNLSQDVTIYAFDQERGFDQRRDVLGMYTSTSNRVKAKYVDPIRQPALAKDFGVHSLGSIVVVAGARHMESKTDDEEGITNALVSVLKGQRTACFIQNHGERVLDGTDGEGYDRFKTQLSNENYQTQTLPFLQKMEIPNDCTMAVIAGPQNDYLPPETDVIARYLQSGGRVLAMLDAGVDLPNLSKLLADWGVTVRNDLVIDENPVAQLVGLEPYMPLILKYGTNPIVQPLNGRATIFPMSRSLEVGKESKPGVTVDSLCETSSDSYEVPNWTPKIREIKFTAGKDLKGPFSLAAAGSTSGSEEKKTGGRFVVLGTSLIAANGMLNQQSNRDFIMNSINWLSADEDLISIRPTPPTSQHLTLTEEEQRRLLFLGVFGIPILIVMAGVLVWWQRR